MLSFELMVSCQRLGHHFSNKVIQNLIFSKNVNSKNVLLNWYSSTKKNEKDLDVFDVEN